LHLITISDTHTQTHIHSVRLLWTSDRPDAETSTCTTRNIHSRQISIHPAGLESTAPASKQLQTNALEDSSAEIGCKKLIKKPK